MITKQGNIIDAAFAGEFDAMFHQTNCQYKMGSGIAKQIRERCPVAYEDYMATDLQLGGLSGATLDNGVMIINLNGQQHYMPRGVRHTNYAALVDGISRAVRNYTLKHIAIPKIGSDLGGGDWETVKELMEDLEPLLGIQITYYEYTP